MKPDPLDDDELDELALVLVASLAKLDAEPPEPADEDEEPLPAVTSSPTEPEIDAIVPAVGA